MLDHLWYRPCMSTGKIVLITFIVSVITSAGTFFGLQAYTSGALSGGGGGSEDGVVIPQLGGLTTEQARKMLEAKGLLLIVTERREDAKIQAGRIVSQSPLEDSTVKKGTEIKVIISTGQTLSQVPALMRLALATATQTLVSSGFKAGAVTRQVHAGVPKDHVISSLPPAGQTLAKGGLVNLVVSDGAGTVEVPRVVLRNLAQARKLLSKAGFTLGKISYQYDEDRREGVVLRQKPAGKSSAVKGIPVDLVINQEQ